MSRESEREIPEKNSKAPSTLFLWQFVTHPYGSEIKQKFGSYRMTEVGDNTEFFKLCRIFKLQ